MRTEGRKGSDRLLQCTFSARNFYKNGGLPPIILKKYCRSTDFGCRSGKQTREPCRSDQRGGL